MTEQLKNVTAYSDATGLVVVRALEGSFDPIGHTITVEWPYAEENGGPVRDDPYQIGADTKRGPTTYKKMKYDGKIPRTDSMFFVAAQ